MSNRKFLCIKTGFLNTRKLLFACLEVSFQWGIGMTCEFLGYLFDSHETTAICSVERIEKIAARFLHVEKKERNNSKKAEYLNSFCAPISKIRNLPAFAVIPAKAGIHYFQDVLVTGFRRYDGIA